MDETRRILETIAKPSNRSSLFWWMLEHHDEVVQAASGGRLNWKQICLEVTAIGLTNVSGGRVTEATARKTWFRVRREKARRDEASKRRDDRRAAMSEARAKERSPRSGGRCRLSLTWALSRAGVGPGRMYLRCHGRK
jgi:hypothetical protein